MITRNAVVVGLTVVCAVAGGLLGVLLVWDLGTGRPLAVLAISMLLGVAVGLLSVEKDPVPEPEPVIEPTTEPARPEFVPAAAPSPEAVRPGNNRTWWTQTPGQPAAVRTGRPATATPLSSYDANRAMVAQCPRCGDFQLDVAQDREVYAFRCRNPNCGHRWEWRDGTPWPTTVVRRNLTG